MPTKRIIVLDRMAAGCQCCRAALWADVPVANRIAYANPRAKSLYKNASPAELQAIRDGLVAEKEVSWSPPSGAFTMAAAQTFFQAEWTAWQNEITALVAWDDYGRYWNDSSVWITTPGIPAVSHPDGDDEDKLPTFIGLTPVSAFGASKVQFVLYNGASLTTALNQIVKVRLVAIKPGTSAVTGAAPGPWTLRRRSGLSTPPSGTGSVAAVAMDSADVLPTTVTLWNAPQVAPAGGTLATINEFVPQADEQKLTTADAPTMSAILNPWGGQIVYRSPEVVGGRPLVIRPGESLEVAQNATAGTGNAQVMCLFTVG